MDLSIDELARLARLELTGEEKELYARQLDNILLSMKALNEIETGDTEPTSHVLPLRNVVRDDARGESLRREEALMNAPDRTEKFYRVPKIIE